MILSNILPLLLFLEDAPDEPAPSFLWPMLGIGAIFWFVMIAPERKRKKERGEMITSMKKGDKVMTTSGMYGTIAQVQGDVVTLSISDNVRVKFALAAIQGPIDLEKKDDKSNKIDTKKAETATEVEAEVVESK
ncbi:MAG: preprotein translocase subunit YajC [Planctomycetota bacterium]|jgi:preprotein translocase subunit YajC